MVKVTIYLRSGWLLILDAAGVDRPFGAVHTETSSAIISKIFYGPAWFLNILEGLCNHVFFVDSMRYALIKSLQTDCLHFPIIIPCADLSIYCMIVSYLNLVCVVYTASYCFFCVCFFFTLVSVLCWAAGLLIFREIYDI